MAVPGGSFLRDGEAPIVAALEAFNQTQDYGELARVSRALGWTSEPRVGVARGSGPRAMAGDRPRPGPWFGRR
jgi:hypothetical protein